VQFSWGALECIAAHAEESYPQECFGFLLGHFGEGCIDIVSKLCAWLGQASGLPSLNETSSVRG